MSAFVKDILREIKNTFGRFISLFIIMGLGVASLVGIQATTIDMRAIADKAYKEYYLYDLQIKSATGFDDDDIAALKNTAGVETVMPTYIFDVFADFENDMRAVRTYALPDSLNAINITEGRLPQSSGECVLEERAMHAGGYEIGDTLTLSLDSMDDYYDILSTDSFTIVGTTTSPLYISHERGNTTLGDGSLEYYLYLHPSAYKLDVYTDVYLLMSGSHEMDNLTDEYYAYLEEWKRQIEPVGDIRVSTFQTELDDAQIEIDDGWAEYNDGLAELEEKLAEGRQELADAEVELADALIKLEDGQIELDEKIADAKREINKNAADIVKGQDELDKNLSVLNAGQSQLDGARYELAVQLEQLEATAPRGVSPELDAYYAQIDAGFAQLEIKQAEIDYGRTEIATAQAKLDNGRKEISKARTTLEDERIKAQQEIDDGWVEYNDGVVKYNNGVKELEDEEAKARIELADAKIELEDAQEELDDAPEPEWFFFTRKDGVAFDSYYQDTLRLEKIGYVFPLVFFLVAIMVSLTSMSRMVEERRTQIGLYKALGYRPGAIMMKYLVYSLTASVGGGLLGVKLGSVIFPKIISEAYGHLYDMPPVDTPVPQTIALVSIAFAAFSIVAVTLGTCAGSMREDPAHLMRPKPPAVGKRVMLEYLPFIWKRLSFIGKVTARNIFRYKKRFFMTLAGIAGCSALLVTGFGLRDSVGGVAAIQYGRLINYDTRAYIKEITADFQRSEMDAILPSQHLYIREESVDASTAAGGFSASLIVPENPEQMIEFIDLQERKSGKPVQLTADGVLLSEKLARVMDVSVGDTFTVTESGGKSYTAKVTGIVENYVLHYIYMAPEIFDEIFGKEPLFNSVLIFTDDDTALASALLENSDVRAVLHTKDMLSSLSDATDALGVVTIVLIILACALALLVLFNLSNINISERIRELATIKVLGFYNSEVSMYVSRENAAVTTLGIAAGLVGGIFLHRFVLISAEIDLLMFPLIIEPMSYIYSVILSTVFALFVDLIMNIKLARIDMVESLKNIE